MKESLSYFPMDVNPDFKIELIESKFGLIGFGTIIKLWSQCYKEHGYYCKWNDNIKQLFSHKNSSSDFPLTVETLNSIIEASFEYDLFNKELFDKYGILTSSGVQKRYLEGCIRRKGVVIKEEYLLLDYEELPEGVMLTDDTISPNIDSDYENLTGTALKHKLIKDYPKFNFEDYPDETFEKEDELCKLLLPDGAGMSIAEYSKLQEICGKQRALKYIYKLKHYPLSKNRFTQCLIWWEQDELQSIGV